MQLSYYQRGISLLEMLITLALGLVLLAALTSVFTNTLGVNSRSLQASQLQEETLATLGLIVDDLRRSGYTADYVNQVVDPGSANEVFRNTLAVSQHPDEVLNSCVVFSYDADQDGLDSGATEAFGYRLRNQQVQRRQGGAACNENGWQGLTSADVIVVDALEFIVTEVVTGTITEQQVQVRLQAHLQQDPTLSRELTQHVVLRNANF